MKAFITVCLVALFLGASASASTLIDFDNFDVQQMGTFYVYGAPVIAYLNSYGITVSLDTAGSNVWIETPANSSWTAYSGNNAFCAGEGPGSTVGSATLTFSTPLSSFSFIRCAENAGNDTFMQWNIAAYDGATLLGSYGGGPDSGGGLPAEAFTFTASPGSPITSIDIYENSFNWYADSAMFDNFVLTPAAVPEPISMIFFGTGLVAVGGYIARRRMAHKA